MLPLLVLAGLVGGSPAYRCSGLSSCASKPQLQRMPGASRTFTYLPKNQRRLALAFSDRRSPSISTEFIQVNKGTTNGLGLRSRASGVIRRIRSRRKDKQPAGPSAYRRFLQFLGWSAVQEGGGATNGSPEAMPPKPKQKLTPAEEEDVQEISASTASTSNQVAASAAELEVVEKLEAAPEAEQAELEQASSSSSLYEGEGDLYTTSGPRKDAPESSLIEAVAVSDPTNPPQPLLEPVENSSNERGGKRPPRWASIGGRKAIRRSLGVSESELGLFKHFMSSAHGINSLLNLEHIRAYDQLDDDRYRVYCGSFKLLSWLVEPVLDLQISVGNNSVTLKTRSCEIQGDDKVREQNKKFRAAYQYKIVWETDPKGVGYIQTSGDLEMQLQIYTFPFTRLPLSAVEAPGNRLMKALLGYLLPAFMNSLVEDFHAWREDEEKVTETVASNEARA